MQLNRSVFCALLLLLGSGLSALGQIQPATRPASEANRRISVWLITFGPGEEAFEKFGHTSIWIHDPNASPADQDLAYNWGMFDDRQMVFYWHFLQGKLWYWMASDEVFTGPFARIGYLDYYASVLNRSIYLQELNLTPQEKRDITDLLRRTDTDANRFYRYDYYRDNCATKPRDVIDQLVGGRLGTLTKNKSAGVSYRWHTRRLTIQTPFLYTILEAVLGQPVDRPISQWDEMFLPMKLHDRLNEVQVLDPSGSGKMVPVVLSDILKYQSTRPPVPEAPPTVWPWFAGVGLALAGFYLAIGHFVTRRRWARIIFSVAAVPWVLLMGLGGIIMLWGWFFTDHVAAGHNENILQTSPLTLPLVILLPRLVFGKVKFANVTRWLAVLAVAGALVGCVLKLTPLFFQYNYDIIAVTLPVNLAMAFIVWRLVDLSKVAVPTKEPAASGNA